MKGWTDAFWPRMKKYVQVLPAHVVCDFLSVQMNSRQRVEASLRQLERDRALLQHQSAESLRKVEIETDRKRSLENECMCLGEKKIPVLKWGLISQFILQYKMQYILYMCIYAGHHWVILVFFFIHWITKTLLNTVATNNSSTLLCDHLSVNNLRDQLEDLRKRNQNSQISNEKNVQLQKQVRGSFFTFT